MGSFEVLMEGVAWPAMLWTVSSLALVVSCRLFFRLRCPLPEPLFRGESGASYTLGFAMTVPVFLIFSLVWIEAGFLLLTKVACTQAAFSAARAAAVWLPMNQAGHSEAQVRFAARLPLTPYGKTRAINLPPDPPNWSMVEVLAQAEMAAGAYGVISGDEAGVGLITTKFIDVARRTEVLVSAGATYDSVLNPDGEVEVTVVFYPPVLVPGVAAIVQPGCLATGYYRVESICSMPAEYPRNSLRSLSINYKSPQ